MVRIEIHLKEEDNEKLISVAKKDDRNRKNFVEYEIKKIINERYSNDELV